MSGARIRYSLSHFGSLTKPFVWWSRDGNRKALLRLDLNANLDELSRASMLTITATEAMSDGYRLSCEKSHFPCNSNLRGRGPWLQQLPHFQRSPQVRQPQQPVEASASGAVPCSSCEPGGQHCTSCSRSCETRSAHCLQATRALSFSSRLEPVPDGDGVPKEATTWDLIPFHGLPTRVQGRGQCGMNIIVS